MGTELCIEANIPRRLGASCAVLRVWADGGDSFDVPFDYVDGDGESDIYRVRIDSRKFGGESALVYYEILFVRAWDTLFSSSVNNVDFTLESESGSPFYLLFYREDFTTPDWFKGKVMYQIFPDRFNKGSKSFPVREDAILNEDWDTGIPQYGAYPGAKLSNNMFFGGTLVGVTEKLDYLESLGVGVIYMCPIFTAYSNHKYDTGDYETIDAMFGGEGAFDELIEKARERNIRVILDGVFNHTGDNSKYFNRYGSYGEGGASRSRDSEYFGWYNFKSFPDDYESWWGIEILPRLKHENESCRRYFTGADGIGERYIKRGIGGWRLDVADELSDAFLDEFRTAVKGAVSVEEPIIIGEVWENATQKIAYGKRRAYFHGAQLDSVMNYPLKNAIIDYINTKDCTLLYNTLTELYSAYPDCVCHCLMNILGTHDTERILTALGDPTLGEGLPNCELATKRLDKRAYASAVKALRLASVIQYTVFGVPSLYYGDEAGCEGYHDPFCRMPMPWGRENRELLEHYRRLGELRRKESVLANGDFRFTVHDGAYIEYERRAGDERLCVAINLSDDPRQMSIKSGRDVLSPKKRDFCVPPMSFRIIKR
jgi:glycosidase